MSKIKTFLKFCLKKQQPMATVVAIVQTVASNAAPLKSFELYVLVVYGLCNQYFVTETICYTYKSQ